MWHHMQQRTLYNKCGEMCAEGMLLTDADQRGFSVCIHRLLPTFWYYFFISIPVHFFFFFFFLFS
jgi:hypothetical protein